MPKEHQLNHQVAEMRSVTNIFWVIWWKSDQTSIANIICYVFYPALSSYLDTVVMVLIVEVLLLEQDFIAWCVMILIFVLGVR